jgi:hypothetical protein
MWSNEQLEEWKHRKQQYLADTASVKTYKDIYQQRLNVQQEMLQVLNSFLEGVITLKEFNQVFQQKTHVTWNVFHLGGMSGGLFLNKLVKYIPEEETFAHLLRMMLRVPTDQQDGQRHMQAFIRFLEGIISAQQATRAQLQPARVPFFLSAWWHIQEMEQWPIFYLELRHMLLPEEKLTSPLQDPVDTYFAFRARFLTLKQELGLTAWELEQLIKWHYTGATSHIAMRSSISAPYGCLHLSQQSVDVRNGEYSGAMSIYNSAIDRRERLIRKKGQGDIDHTSLQWLLAKIGLKVGCNVWVAINV